MYFKGGLEHNDLLRKHTTKTKLLKAPSHDLGKSFVG